MKISKLFDARMIVSGIVATIGAGAVMFYLGRRVPFLKGASKGFDGNRAL